ncbi:hypothetical protein [Streptomyces sp. NPDC004528]|uniref:hypothetical protein n=1 Tax=Streptomyces sp. NPDC004528 TaxID=3154550 RepID=UPI00339EFF2E
MQEFQKVRLVRIGEGGVSPVADVAMLLLDDGSVGLGVTSLSPEIEVSTDVDQELTEGLSRKLRIRALASEYRPTMDLDVMRAWAAELVSELAGSQ